MHVGAAQLFRRDDLAGGRLHQRRSAEENRALITHDDAFVRHRRDVGATGGAGAHHDRDLRNALGGHLRLIIEDAAEVPFIGENLVLLRQERAAGIDHVDAGQIVLAGDILGAKMLLHRHRIIGAAFDGRIVGDHDAFPAGYPPHPGNDAGGMHVTAIEAVGRKRRQFQKCRAGIDCRARCAGRARFRLRRPPRCPASRGALRPARAWPRYCVRNRTRWDRCWNGAAWPSAGYGAPQSAHGGSRHGVIAPQP